MNASHMKSSFIFERDILAAIVTWLLVAITSLVISQNLAGVSPAMWWAATAMYLVFIVGFLCVCRPQAYQHDKAVRIVWMLIQLIAVLVIYRTQPFSYNAILMVIWSSQIVYFVSFRTACLLSPLWSAPLWIMQTLYWQASFAWITAVLFWTFNLFALVMVDSRRRERESREQAEALNRELLATQELLKVASREEERTRIARNIHDLLGHHLTALTIHLQVAQRQTEGEVQAQISQCHQIAKLLLSDVREAVSDLREQNNNTLESVLTTLTQNVPQLTVHLNVDNTLPALSIEHTETLLRIAQESLTNTLRHADASDVWLDVEYRDGQVTLQVKDNGKGCAAMKEGNGVKGMRERIERLGGTFKINSLHGHFSSQASLPVLP